MRQRRGIFLFRCNTKGGGNQANKQTQIHTGTIFKMHQKPGRKSGTNARLLSVFFVSRVQIPLEFINTGSISVQFSFVISKFMSDVKISHVLQTEILDEEADIFNFLTLLVINQPHFFQYWSYTTFSFLLSFNISHNTGDIGLYCLHTFYSKQ